LANIGPRCSTLPAPPTAIAPAPFDLLRAAISTYAYFSDELTTPQYSRGPCAFSGASATLNRHSRNLIILEHILPPVSARDLQFHRDRRRVQARMAISRRSGSGRSCRTLEPHGGWSMMPTGPVGRARESRRRRESTNFKVGTATALITMARRLSKDYARSAIHRANQLVTEGAAQRCCWPPSASKRATAAARIRTMVISTRRIDIVKDYADPAAALLETTSAILSVQAHGAAVRLPAWWFDRNADRSDPCSAMDSEGCSQLAASIRARIHVDVWPSKNSLPVPASSRTVSLRHPVETPDFTASDHPIVLGPNNPGAHHNLLVGNPLSASPPAAVNGKRQISPRRPAPPALG